MGLHGLLERVHAVDDRVVRPVLDEPPEKEDVLLGRTRDREHDLPVADPRREVRQGKVVEPVGRGRPPGFSDRLARRNEVLPHRVEDDVVGLAVSREVLLQVVDDLVRSSDRTSSTFFVLHTAVTWAPR